jgi:hypothetical protein
MSNILEKMADSFGPFRPSNTREYLALQIAKRLNAFKQSGITRFSLNITRKTA